MLWQWWHMRPYMWRGRCYFSSVRWKTNVHETSMVRASKFFKSHLENFEGKKDENWELWFLIDWMLRKRHVFCRICSTDFGKSRFLQENCPGCIFSTLRIDKFVGEGYFGHFREMCETVWIHWCTKNLIEHYTVHEIKIASFKMLNGRGSVESKCSTNKRIKREVSLLWSCISAEFRWQGESIMWIMDWPCRDNK